MRPRISGGASPPGKPEKQKGRTRKGPEGREARQRAGARGRAEEEGSRGTREMGQSGRGEKGSAGWLVAASTRWRRRRGQEAPRRHRGRRRARWSREGTGKGGGPRRAHATRGRRTPGARACGRAARSELHEAQLQRAAPLLKVEGAFGGNEEFVLEDGDLASVVRASIPWCTHGTPKTLLEGTTGVLLVDGYSGYSVVDEVSTRRRAACHAHLRRYFHEALPTAPIAQEMLDLVAELYRAEHAAGAKGLVGASKLDFRKQRAGPIRRRMRRWLEAQSKRHPPKSPIAAAIRYADNQWEELGVFLDDERVPLDNNGSERALRRVALGRKNYLFVHDVERGESLAGLYSLVATCEARGINPFEYLADVLARVQDHPARDLDQLLPGAWIATRNDE